LRSREKKKKKIEKRKEKKRRGTDGRRTVDGSEWDIFIPVQYPVQMRVMNQYKYPFSSSVPFVSFLFLTFSLNILKISHPNVYLHIMTL
jgi:hypothetical protein